MRGEVREGDGGGGRLRVEGGEGGEVGEEREKEGGEGADEGRGGEGRGEEEDQCCEGYSY